MDFFDSHDTGIIIESVDNAAGLFFVEDAAEESNQGSCQRPTHFYQFIIRRLKNKKLQNELSQVNREIRKLKKQIKTLEERKIDLLKALENQPMQMFKNKIFYYERREKGKAVWLSSPFACS